MTLQKNLVERRRRKNLRITSKPIETVPIRKSKIWNFLQNGSTSFFNGPAGSFENPRGKIKLMKYNPPVGELESDTVSLLAVPILLPSRALEVSKRSYTSRGFLLNLSDPAAGIHGTRLGSDTVSLPLNSANTLA